MGIARKDHTLAWGVLGEDERAEADDFGQGRADLPGAAEPSLVQRRFELVPRVDREALQQAESTCSAHVDEATFGGILLSAATDAQIPVVVVEKRMQARDHPVLLSVPETYYLKCFVLRKLED
jgi:hypothetical protein